MEDTLVRRFKTAILKKPKRGTPEFLKKIVEIGSIINEYIILKGIKHSTEEPYFKDNIIINNVLTRKDCEDIAEYFGTSAKRVLKSYSVYLVRDILLNGNVLHNGKVDTKTIHYVLFSKYEECNKDRDLDEYYELSKLNNDSLIGLSNHDGELILHNKTDNERMMRLITREHNVLVARYYYNPDVLEETNIEKIERLERRIRELEER